MVMKKISLLLATLTLALALSAQDYSNVGKFAGGVRGGATISQISGDNLSGFHKVGATAGVFANCVLVDNPKFDMKLQMELDFVMKGSHSYTPPKQVASLTGKYSLNLGYLEVPVLLRMRFARITIRNSSDFDLEVGPAFGVNVYHVERDMYGIIHGRPDFNRWELSLIAGLNYTIKEHHGIGLRYSNSILSVRTPNWAVNRRILKQYSSVIYLTYSYQF